MVDSTPQAGAYPALLTDPVLRRALLMLAVLSSVLVTGAFGIELPTAVSLGVFAVLGLIATVRAFTDAEWLLAFAIVYIPLNKVFVFEVFGGLNGTNLVLIAVTLAWIVQAMRRREPLFRHFPFSRTMGALAIWSFVSVIVAIISFGPSFMTGDNLLAFKEFISQFLLFFAMLNLIRGGATARRMIIYLMVAFLIVMLFGFSEWLDKRDAHSMEASRLMGPQQQPNDFGAFLVYGSGPFIGMALTFMTRPWVYMFDLPILLVLARILVSTFSRGAYLGLLLGGVAAAWGRGRRLFIAGIFLAAVAVVAMPSLIPESAMARLEQTTSRKSETGNALESSAEARLILWQAALEMTIEDPILGKGFKAFPVLKHNYTTTDVPETDNHNMYLYLSSQMGVPAVLLLVLVYLRAYLYSVRLARAAADPFVRVIGIAGLCTVVGVFVTNIFGSRLTDAAVSMPFWVMLAVVANLSADRPPGESPRPGDPAPALPTA